MSDIVDTSPLGIERTERIAGDDALNSRLDNVTTELQGTQASVTTEVLHRSEGDLVIQRVLEGYIQDLLEGKAEDFERYIEFQNSQNLNYADVRNFVSSIRTSLADDIRDLSTSLMSNLQANDARYNKLVSDVGRYLEILSDITLDSNQITLDNGELRAGAWTILSQARAWDLEIISRLNGLSESVGDSLKDAVEEIQNQLPSTEETITKAIEELSKSPLIKELSDLLNQSIENDIAYELALLEQARKHANEMAQLAEDMRAEALAKAQEMEDYMAGEVTARITEVNKEVAARKEAIDVLTEDMLTRVDQDKADFQADMLAVSNRIKSAEDGLTSEIQHRKDGDTSTLNALNVYKVSNDSAITGLSTSLSNNVTKTSANTSLITGLTSRLETAEDGIESATTAAADAMSKATTAVTANSALSTRVDALAASITDSEDTVVDVNAFNALKAEVNTVKGTVTGLVEDVTALESNYTSVNNKVTTQGTAISTLNTKMVAAEDSLSQSANDITLLKTDISSVNASLLTKVDSQAFSQLSSDVTELDGKYTTQAGLVTDLRGSLDTTNVNVANAASAAQNALTTAGSKGKVIFGTSAPAVADRLSQNLWIDATGGANTPKRWNGSAWVVVTDKVATDALAAANAATILVNTKADTSAFNSLDQKVTVMDGKVSTNTNSITSLNGKMAIVEGGLATKLDSSAIVNYYTKQQADDNALSTAAGEISKFSATLRIGGDNLLKNSNVTIHKPEGTAAYLVGRYDSWTSLRGKKVTLTACVSVSGGTSAVRLVAYQGSGLPIIFSETEVNEPQYASVRNSSKAIVRAVVDWHETTSGYNDSGVNFYIYPNSPSTSPNMEVTVHWATLVEGDVLPSGAWYESDYALNTAIDANAYAINSTNTEVSRVEGKTTVNANNISGLTSRMGTVEGQVSTKAESSALQDYYTKNEAATNATTVAAGEVAKYNAALKIGSKNLLADAKWVTPAISTVNKANGYEFKLADSTSPYLDEWGRYGPWTELEIGTQYVFSFKIKALNSTPLNVGGHVTGISGTGADAVYLDGVKVEGATFAAGTSVVIPNDGKYHLVVVLLTKNVGGSDSIHIQPNRLTSYTQPYNCSVKEVMLSEGNAYSQWVEPDEFIQGQLDANATAITNTNSEVVRVEGKVTANSNSILALNSSVSNLGNTKLNSSVIAGYYTKAQTDDKVESVTSGSIASFKSGLSAGAMDSLVIGGNEPKTKTGGYLAVQYELSKPVVPGKTYTIRAKISFSNGGNAAANLRFYLGGQTEFHPSGGITSAEEDVIEVSAVVPRETTQNVSFYCFPNSTANANAVTTVHWVEVYEGANRTLNEKATATALSTTNTEVSRVNGVVSGHTQQLSNLTASIAGKADTSALNALTVRVAAEEGKTSSQATSITNLNSSVADVLDTVTIKDVRSTNELPNFYWTNYSRRRVNEFKYQTAIGVSSYFADTYCNLETVAYWADASGGPIIQTATSGIDPSLYVQRQSVGSGANAVWSAWKQPIKDLRDGLAGKASASALSTLDTQVVAIDGRVTTQASQLIVLTSDNNANKNALTVQGKVIDGVKSSYMVKMETNGVIGGFGLMQSTGVLGQVVTTFGVNANAFFIGAPASKKQPFIVTTANQEVNGVKYPAGTYIDVALIANATIGNAHIADASITNAKIKELDASKITTGTLDAQRIRVGSSTQFDAGFAPTDVLNSAKTYVDDNTGNLLNNTTVSGTRDKWSSVATVTEQDFFGKTVPVLTLSGTTNMGANSSKFKVDPSKAYEVSFWAKADVALGTMYFGAIAYNSAGGNVGFNAIPVSTGAETTAVNANLYFWIGSNASLPVGEWRKYTAYIMPVGTPGPSMKGLGESVTTNARFLPDTSELLIRWFNYTTAGQSTKWAANFKCVEVDPNAVIAAKAAQVLADSKTQTFTVQPTTPYASGDIYRNGASIYVCTTSRASGSYVAADWTLVGDVTSANTAANANQLGGKAAATVFNDITAAKNAADAANGQVVLWKYPNSTYIDGGKIYANSVTANQISVANLSAISSDLGTIKVGTANIEDLAVDTIKIKDNAVTSLLEVQRTQQRVEQNFKAIPSNTLVSNKIKAVLMSGLSKNNRYLVYWRGVIGAGMSSRLSNTPPYFGWARKRVYFGSTSSTDIVGSRILAENNQLDGNYIRWYESSSVSTGNVTQWNVAEGIVDETGSLCLWVDVEWKSFMDNVPADTLYGYLYMSELSVLISEFKK